MNVGYQDFWANANTNAAMQAGKCGNTIKRCALFLWLFAAIFKIMTITRTKVKIIIDGHGDVIMTMMIV